MLERVTKYACGGKEEFIGESFQQAVIRNLESLAREAEIMSHSFILSFSGARVRIERMSQREEFRGEGPIYFTTESETR